MLEGSAGEQNDRVVNLEVHKPLGRAPLTFLSVTGSRAAAASSEVAAFCLELGPGFLMGSPSYSAPCPCWAGPPVFPLGLRKWLCRKRHGRGWGALGHWCTKPQNRLFSKLPSQWGQRQMLCIISYPEGKVLLQISFWRKKKKKEKNPKRLQRIQVFGSEHHKMRTREAQVRIPDLPFCKLCDLNQAP